MTPVYFLNEFGAVANAPGGVQRLREMILQLAVQGKLVEQNPEDEPASVLMEKIVAEKERLIKDKKIKKIKKLPEIIKNEHPFKLQNGWVFTRYSEVYDVRDGTHDSPKPQKVGFPLVTSKNLSSGKLDLTSVTFISEDDYLKINQRSKVDYGDILFAMIGSIGNPVIVDIDAEFSIKNVALFKYYNPCLSVPEYLKISLEVAAINVKSQSSGGVQPFVSLGKLRSHVFPLPPLEEQKRIVAKVDQLMALCDQLEAQQQKRSDLVKQTRISALEALANAQRGEELQVAWKRVEKNLPTLFESPEDVEDLKKCILQNAVMGKLVPQNPDDEPASELLKKIAKEKAELIKKGEIKRQNPLPEIRDDEKPFEVPTGWEWCRLNDLGYVIGGGTPSKSNQSFWSGSIPWISPKDMKVDYIYDAQDHISNDAISNSSVKLIPPNSVLMVLRGMILAHSFPLAITERVVTINQDMKALRLYLPEMSKFSLVLLKGCKSRYLKIVERSSHGTCRLDTDKLFSSTIALPPLEEQKRIVKKTQSLLSLCDTLQKQLAKSRKVAEQLAQSVVVSITGISPEKQPEKKLNDWIEEPEKAEIRIVEAQVNQK